MAEDGGAGSDAQSRCGEDTGLLLRLRPAHDHDRGFLQAVFESTRADEFAQTGWDAERIAAVLAQQFSAQDAYYRQHYLRGRFDVIVQGATAIGRLYHDWCGSEARLIDIALLPAYRGAGLGGRIVRAFVARAAARAMPIVLYVEMNNPVQALYRRLGFEPIGENGVYVQMRRAVAPFADADAMPVAGLASDAAEQD
ncbi:GNAT family N-acetyltransferase [Trinickia soli]|uniref:GNAT family N-acetyltransferase n=1 Tax=Trinickia soli TaxID=380675 RepID=UPI0013580A3E